MENWYSRTNGKTIKIESGLSGSGQISAQVSFSSQNLDKCYGAFSYYIDGGSNINYMLLYVSTTICNYYRLNTLPYSDGYHYVEFDLEGGLKGYGSYDVNNITNIRFVIGCDNNDVNFYFDSLKFIKNYSKPRVMLGLDNGLASNYSVVYPALQERGIKATFAIIADRIGDTGYMTDAQINTMYNAGHLIVCHSWDHTLWQDRDGDMSFNPLMYYERVEQMLRAKEFLVKKRLDRCRVLLCASVGN